MSGITERASRQRALRALGDEGEPVVRADGFWEFESNVPGRRDGRRLLVVADLHRCARAFATAGVRAWRARVSEWQPMIVGLVRTERDRRHAAIVDDLVVASDDRFSVCEVKPRSEASWRRWAGRALASVDIEAVLAVRYAPVEDLLWLHFGDGLRATLAWSKLGVDDASLRRETIAVSEDLAALEVLSDDGCVFDIDAALVRSLVDARHAARLAAEAHRADASLGSQLRSRREAAGLTQQALADRSGLEQALISKLEGGKHRPRYDTLERYAGGLGEAVSDVLA